MSAQNKAVMRRIYEELWNQGNFDVLDELVSPDYVGHLPTPPGAPTGRDGLVWLIQTYRSAFPDVHVQIEDQIAEGEKVMTHVIFQGTHENQFMHIAPTGKTISVEAFILTRFENGLNVEGWVGLDRLVLMQQLGAIPAPQED
jgi:predicted ester cyclase